MILETIYMLFEINAFKSTEQQKEKTSKLTLLVLNFGAEAAVAADLPSAQ